MELPDCMRPLPEDSDEPPNFIQTLRGPHKTLRETLREIRESAEK
jgi:hypothetical protein